jgi:hypothetical protein
MQIKGFIIGTGAFQGKELTHLWVFTLIYRTISVDFESFLPVGSSYGKVILHVS